jgi:hypothetical protein
MAGPNEAASASAAKSRLSRLPPPLPVTAPVPRHRSRHRQCRHGRDLGAVGHPPVILALRRDCPTSDRRSTRGCVRLPPGLPVIKHRSVASAEGASPANAGRFRHTASSRVFRPFNRGSLSTPVWSSLLQSRILNEATICAEGDRVSVLDRGSHDLRPIAMLSTSIN